MKFRLFVECFLLLLVLLLPPLLLVLWLPLVGLALLELLLWLLLLLRLPLLLLLLLLLWLLPLLWLPLVELPFFAVLSERRRTDEDPAHEQPIAHVLSEPGAAQTWPSPSGQYLGPAAQTRGPP